MRIAAALLLTVMAAVPAWAQGGPPIRVGFGSAMSGPSAITGEGVVWGGTMAVDEVNAKGGIMGRKVEVFFADNKGTPGEAVSAVRKLVDVDRVDVIVGQTHSGACLGALPIIKELQVPMVIESCSNPKIRELMGKGGNEWVFRVNIDDEIMAYTFAKSMARSAKSVTVIAQNDDFGRGGATAYEAAFKKIGLKLASTEFFDRGQPDYRPLLTRVKRAGADAVLLIMLASDGSVFMRQFRELGLTHKLFARGSMATVEFLNQVKDNPRIGDGLVEATYWAATLDPAWEREWLARWKTPVRVHGSLAAIAFKHAVVPAIEAAIKKTGRADRAAIRDALEQLDVKDSPVGPIKFDESHQAWINMLLIEMRDGQLKVLEKLPTSPALLK
ncbi:MAG: ABC transporter substrate-binding protein [Candidatus Rokubacteria bacterium]|nr:ABC transporter substrate-binding protein [Candidatus Rokubacteria bacterium]